MWEVIKKLLDIFEPQLSKIKWQYLLALILTMILLSVIYLSPGGIMKAFSDYIVAIQLTPSAIKSSNSIPLTEDQKKILQLQINRISSQLNSVYESHLTSRNKTINAWALSQLGISLGSKEIFSSNIYQEKIPMAVNQESGGWPEFKDQPDNLIATLWALLALNETSALPKESINYVLNQQTEGFWALYKLPFSKENASTFVTAFSLLTLNKWQNDKRLDENQFNRIHKAIDVGINWLLDHRIDDNNGGIWNDYPDNDTEGSPSIAVSALVLHTLKSIQFGEDRYNFKKMASQLISKVPNYDFPPWHKEVAGVALFGNQETLTKNEPPHGMKDTARYYILPWVLIFYADAYSEVGLRDRIEILSLIERLTENSESYTSRMNVTGRSWIAAEYLLALKYIIGEKLI